MRMGIRCLKNEAALKLMATIRINLLPHCVLFLFVNLVALGSAARAEDPRNSRLEQFVETQPNFTTTDVLGEKNSRFWLGTHHTTSGTNSNGTGNQFFYGGFEYGLTDKFQIGIERGEYTDPPIDPIAGTSPNFRFIATSLYGKYRIIDRGPWTVSAQASLESLVFRSEFFGKGPNDTSDVDLIGSFHLPVSYMISPRFRLDFTPGISFLPDEQSGSDFFGTVAQLGAGFSYKPHARWQVYGNVNVALSGDNSISSSGDLERKPVLTFGGRYNVSPAIGLDVFVTNGGGVTPATQIIPAFPDANTAFFGAVVSYTPGAKNEVPQNYRGLGGEPLSARNRQLQHNGFTLASADTFSPGTVNARFTLGSEDSWSGALVYSPTYDGQIELTYEQFSEDGSVDDDVVPSFDPAYTIGVKLRFLDQNNGSRFSLSGLAKIGEDSQTATYFASAPAMYKSSSRLAFLAEPKFAAWGDVDAWGFGFGLNFEALPGMVAIAEYTPVTNGDNIWAGGIRKHFKNSPVTIELFATNAVGAEGYGTMVAQEDVRFSVGASIALGFNTKNLTRR